MIAQARRRVQQPRSVPLGAEKLFKLRFDQPSKDRIVIMQGLQQSIYLAFGQGWLSRLSLTSSL
jgi:hypothetical protein